MDKYPNASLCGEEYHYSMEHRALLEKLIVAQLVQKFPAFYGT